MNTLFERESPCSLRRGELHRPMHMRQIARILSLRLLQFAKSWLKTRLFGGLILGSLSLLWCALPVSAQRPAPPLEALFPQYNFRYLYSGAEWTNRPPKSPTILTLLHRRLPLVFSIVAENIDLTTDVDAVTLAK